jgi:hypothetical protein
VKTTRILLAVAALLLGAGEVFGQIVWNGNGDGTSWSDPQNWVGNQVPGTANSATITSGNGTTVLISSVISVQSVQCNKALTISNGSLTVMSGTSALGGAVTVSDGSALVATGSGTILSVSGPGNITGASLYASGGAELLTPGVVSYQPPVVCETVVWQATGTGSLLDLSFLTNVTGNITCSQLTVQALNGGEVSLSHVKADLGGTMSVQSDGSNSLVDLSSLSTNGGTLGLEASGGGDVVVPQLATSGNLTVSAGAGGSVSTGQFTNITGASFYASGGVALLLPGVVNYQPPAVCETIVWQATGAGSEVSLPALTNVTGNTACSQLTVQALNGGTVFLSQIKADLGGTMSVQADGTNSLVDLSLLATNLGTLSFEATGGGVLAPQLRASGNLIVTLGSGGAIPTAQFTNITGASFYAIGGARLSLPGVVSYQPPAVCETIVWQATGAGSLVSLSALTNVTGNSTCSQLTVQSLNGGEVLLNHAQAIPGGAMSVQADGTNSVVDLSMLAANAGTLSLEASSGGSVLAPLLANGGTINLTLGAGGFISTDQFTNITGASLFATGGAVLSLPGVVSYQPPSICEAITWQANGAGSMLSLPALTNLTGNTVCGQLNAQALSGGQILLGHVADINNGYLSFLSDGVGSVIDLSQLSGMVLVDGQGSLTAQNGGTILFNSQAFLLANVAINISPGNPVLPPTVIPSQALTLYGTPWHSYQVEERNTLQPGSPWTTILIPLTNNLEAIAGQVPQDTAFTVTEFVADPSILQLSLASSTQAQLLLYGQTNATYEIQSTTNFSAPASWTSNGVVVMTNAFRFLPLLPVDSDRQFFRTQKQ